MSHLGDIICWEVLCIEQMKIYESGSREWLSAERALDIR